MSRRIKVLQLQPEYNVKRYAFADLPEQIILGLPPDRYEVVSAFLRGCPGEGDPVSRAARSVYFRFTDAQLKGARLRALWRLYRFCRDERFDAVVCHRFKPANIMLFLAKLLGIPRCIAITHTLGDYDRAYRRLQVRLLADARWRFVGVSETVRDELLGHGAGFVPANTSAIINAIDIDEAESLQLERCAAREALGLPSDARVVGTIGRLVPVKGHIDLIRAFAALAARHPDVILAIIGGGREHERLEAEIGRLGLAGQVRLLGARPNALQYVRAFDIWAMPSYAEGFPLALLEAMSGALPIVASDIPSMREEVAGAGGRLFPPGDVAALEAALEDYLSLEDGQLRRRGEAALDYLRHHHSLQDYRQAYRALIDSAIGAESA